MQTFTASMYCPQSMWTVWIALPDGANCGIADYFLLFNLQAFDNYHSLSSSLFIIILVNAVFFPRNSSANEGELV